MKKYWIRYEFTTPEQKKQAKRQKHILFNFLEE